MFRATTAALAACALLSGCASAPRPPERAAPLTIPEWPLASCQRGEPPAGAAVAKRKRAPRRDWAELLKELARWFEQQGVKLHHYTLPIPRDLHRRIHGNDGQGGPWNQAWRDFKEANQRASPEEIFKHAGELIYRFQLLGGPIQPYYSRPGT